MTTVTDVKAVHTNYIKQVVLIVTLTLAALLLAKVPTAKAATGACPAPSTDYGSVTSTVNITNTTSYRIWSRIMAPDTTNNSYSLEIDGSSCFVVGDSSSIPANTWTWVDYQNGTSSSKIDVSLSAGSHTIKMIGREPDVKLDRVILASDTSCVPSGFGDNCASDTTALTTSVTAPTNGSTVSGTVNVTASASDDIGVTKVEFYVDNASTPASTDTVGPTYSFNWNTTSGVSNGSHTLKTKAYDAAGNVTTSSTVTVTVNNVTGDTTPPTTSITAPTNGSTVSGTVAITATASDNVGVSRVDLYVDGVLSASDTASPYSFSWNTTSGVNNGTHTLTTKAFDAANNNTTSTAVTVTVNNVVVSHPGDVNGDGHVTLIDMAILLSNYSTSGKTRSQGDLSGDGVVNLLDLATLLTNYGT